ncbi:MAG: N-acetylneuraminic acid synthase [Rhodospirillaceae bacterium TMED8]|nr:N-acetylneuraminic acid synthase [Magnetovibrio sp.]OUT50126.1 MAG: N-acetylneuraminic acid synthase [Rhodospirillaceae bacterium TMED8]
MTGPTTQFIAEISSNHGQELGRCLSFVEAAVASGCDAVKFQMFEIDKLFSKEVLANSQKHREREAWELPEAFLKPIALACQNSGISFGCTPFYLDAIQKLVAYVDFFKIASYELLWDELIRACSETGKPIILSTGMATLKEVMHAVEVAKRAGAKDLTVLHCVSAYPAPLEQCNLAAIETIRQNTGCKAGWSDHTVSPAIINRSINRWGAEVIEFHLDLEGCGSEFASGHCWLPDQIAAVISDVRIGSDADGSGIKYPATAELPDRLWRADPDDGLRPLKQIRKTL